MKEVVVVCASRTLLLQSRASVCRTQKTRNVATHTSWPSVTRVHPGNDANEPPPPSLLDPLWAASEGGRGYARSPEGAPFALLSACSPPALAEKLKDCISCVHLAVGLANIQKQLLTEDAELCYLLAFFCIFVVFLSHRG